ncbi:MAG: Eco57I restriction-modification methylase domain-containing protein [Candidatus Sumerlaeota bacterium]|nr:Eco57I restriction-modification methylase domain-containing protein [Candidatus Sumerlaeota bacterium]
MIRKSFDQAKDEIAKLCQYFATNRQAFLAFGVKEAHVRQSLIDPFFEALGWDVRNTAMIAPQYREVIPEASLDVEGQQKAPDYTFRVGTLPKFYAEAKKRGTNIQEDPGPAYQLRRYGWSAKVPLSILTDFEELGIYDCASRPQPSDKASHARIQYFRFEEYSDRWRELWDVFSRDAVWSGAFDQYAASKRKRGTSEVDDEFLKEIEGWREALARIIALRNTNLSSDDLNAAVQRTIDRVVFLRMAEDRGLEPYGQLLKLCERPEIYDRFMRDVCRRADDKYNSGLFHFQKESGVSEPPDGITPHLAVDDKVFKPIIQSLYFAHGSPYHFGVLPVEILGTVYERFLGKVIRLTSGHQAKVEEKPEVRKAGGVYYTPAYIVDYIVKHAVGRRIEGKSPMQLAGLRNGKQPFRMLDIACGSGLFLLGAYQFLLDQCLKWYLEHSPQKHKKAVHNGTRSGQWRLTIEEKKRILITHIFGVDIDPQAVEVTKLSLLLKVLEGENDVSLVKQLTLFQERALPNLAENIKCGNSLIGPDYFTGKLIHDPDEMKRVNPFDWKTAFPDAMKAGGFDCIIGNPPYIRIQTMKEWAPLEVEIYKELYRAANAGNYDIYVVFIEQGLNLLNSKGLLGFICPHKFFNSKYGEPIRDIIAKGRHLSHVVRFGANQVFAGATTYTCLLFLGKMPESKCQFAEANDLTAWRAEGIAAKGQVSLDHVTSNAWNFYVGRGKGLGSKLSAMSSKLGDAADIFVGLQTSADDVYIMDFVSETSRTYRLRSQSLSREWIFEKDLLFPLVSGTDVSRYDRLPNRQYILFPYAVRDERAELIDFEALQRTFPKTAAYLSENKKRLEGREKGSFKDAKWHRFGRSQNLGIQQRPKLCVPRLVEHLHAAYDHDGSHFLDNVDVGGVTFKAAFSNQGLGYLLTLLNSRLMQWYFPQISAPFRGGWWSANRQFLSLLPVRIIDFENVNDAAIHRQLAVLTDSIQKLYCQLASAKSSPQKTVIQRQIDATDAEIDRLVYDLYGLTDKEIAIVEGEQ